MAMGGAGVCGRAPRASPSDGAVEGALGRMRPAAEGSENLFYPMKEALGELATLGEVSDILREIFGQYRP